jgi:hypothetical protein
MTEPTTETTTETTTDKPKKAKAEKRPPLFAILIEGGDTDDDGTADVRVRAHVAGRVLLDFRKDIDATVALRVVMSVVNIIRRTFGRL